ncbi:contact-dependent growth inhibition system immunity protein [Saccharopolyspora cebuensis]|uniref:Contact-dependent growth inhibition system immunity protein n=1 Tax=Saccharopolyspora cebuensis TaxID=418759 RepID=A0ABV4CM49_9PSEU
MNYRVPDDPSLEQIENDAWGDPPQDATKLIATVHRLRRKPISALNDADLRVLVGQNVGLDTLMPRVLERLEHDPLLEADFYPGDLLTAVLAAPSSYWTAHPDHRTRIEHIIAGIDNPDPQLKADIEGFERGIRP